MKKLIKLLKCSFNIYNLVGICLGIVLSIMVYHVIITGIRLDTFTDYFITILAGTILLAILISLLSEGIKKSIKKYRNT